MKRTLLIVSLVLASLFLSNCGPSAEEIATQTAAAWTPTPPPTPTPTPLPFDMKVLAVDDTGAPIAGASILFPGAGSDQPVQVDDQGSYSWADLQDPGVALDVSAAGYQPAHQTATLERGPNEIKVVLQRDPFGIIPTEACPSGQKVLYLEDFQDGQAQGWPELAAGIGGQMPNGWNLADESGNKILVHANAPTPGGDELQNMTFDNFAWHAKFKVVGTDADMFFMWRVSHPDPASRLRYVVVLSAKAKPWMVRFLDQQSGPMAMNTGTALNALKPDAWHDITVTYFNGVHQVWYDGKKQIEYKDPQPTAPGTIGFETHLDSTKTTQFFIDDMVVCELTAAYEPAE